MKSPETDSLVGLDRALGIAKKQTPSQGLVSLGPNPHGYLEGWFLPIFQAARRRLASLLVFSHTRGFLGVFLCCMAGIFA